MASKMELHETQTDFVKIELSCWREPFPASLAKRKICQFGELDLVYNVGPEKAPPKTQKHIIASSDTHLEAPSVIVGFWMGSQFGPNIL